LILALKLLFFNIAFWLKIASQKTKDSAASAQLQMYMSAALSLLFQSILVVVKVVVVVLLLLVFLLDLGFWRRKKRGCGRCGLVGWFI
jgi:hypothetical protein